MKRRPNEAKLQIILSFDMMIPRETTIEGNLRRDHPSHYLDGTRLRMTRYQNGICACRPRAFILCALFSISATDCKITHLLGTALFFGYLIYFGFISVVLYHARYPTIPLVGLIRFYMAFRDESGRGKVGQGRDRAGQGRAARTSAVPENVGAESESETWHHFG